ncbi:MAG: cob(I)yrinic acid a,c-diamide adenosyltransferase [Candidatus Eisenbacteria bacterium]|uniref:Corrinoid adenosyltransferase n=1 Tax=Eiseniibacteriota bacterium TaxID=2212470 RepID=A0A849SR50_UNCEI|nr:cob(I)yrinic acid a,c-diamide adenosyltransferase [Candidatus Eisenbacteria bacterium]
MKIYTRTGDDGTTGLLGAGRVSKAEPRVEAYGSVDELNALLGLVRVADTGRAFEAVVTAAQECLFTLGARLAASGPEMLARLAPLEERDIEALEREIDRLDGTLPPLTQFVLPGGSALAAQLHHARTVCRRAERRVVALSGVSSAEPIVVRYLNRLADLLFVMARAANQSAGVSDTPWTPRPRS